MIFLRTSLIVAVTAWIYLGASAETIALWNEPPIPGASADGVKLGGDLDGDGDPDEVDIRLEVIELTEEVYPGEFVTFWVFAPEGQGMTPAARAPSPTIRVEEGDRVRITLHNTHYFPHTIHLHGTIHPNAMDGVPDITQPAVKPGEAFTYEFIAKNPGTHFYHCHVQPDVHVLMGLVGMLIIEPNRPENLFRHLVPGAGQITDLSRAVMERYEQEYSLVYMDIDDRLNRIPAAVFDPREIEKRMHREYDSTRREPNIFLLNGRSFPFTLRDTPINVRSGERVKLRVLNAGERTMHLHAHGHHPTQTHVDGYELPSGMQIIRDVFTIGAAQRVDLELRAGSDDYYASGPGVWIVHDHTERATTNKGINPGGDIAAIVYEGYRDEASGLPKVATNLDRFFDPAFYRGEVPVFETDIFHTTDEEYEYGWDEEELAGGLPDYPMRQNVVSIAPQSVMETHQAVARSCEQPRGFRRIALRGGKQFAKEGEVFAFEPRVIRAEPCEEIEIVLENTDKVRHALMLPGLNPMFMLEFTGTGTRTARFVTPDQDITLEFHCHVETHEKMGMHGKLIVGRGGEPAAKVQETPTLKHIFEGIGTIVSVKPRESRIVLDHEEIEDFMGPMIMSYLVDTPTKLQGLKPGQKVRFTIDADLRAIIEIEAFDRE